MPELITVVVNLPVAGRLDGGPWREAEMTTTMQLPVVPRLGDLIHFAPGWKPQEVQEVILSDGGRPAVVTLKPLNTDRADRLTALGHLVEDGRWESPDWPWSA